jgi:hypothetical protein
LQAVDVSSGVEADGPDGHPQRGIKDADKIHRFVAAVRAADAQLAKNPHEFLLQHPDPSGHFGPYGGSFVSETLTHAIQELRETYAKYQNDPEFLAEFHYELASTSLAALHRSTTLRA